MPAADRRPRPTRRPAARAPAALLVAAVLGACMTEQTPEAALRAARADSAAAGYPVGQAPGDSTEPGHIELEKAIGWLRARFAGAGPADSVRAPVVAIAPPAPVGRARDRGAAATTPPVAPAPADSIGADTVAGATPDGRPEPDSLVAAGDFLSYNPARRTVRLRAVAGHNGVNESLNFNGAVRGSRIVVVPLGWRVEVEFRQADEALAHSALVATALEQMPVDAPAPAFPGAATRRTIEGIIEGGTDTFAFAADRAGRYVVQCGVAGHAQAGMWLRLVVDSAAVAPVYR
jgi:hypothetical protein